MMDRRQPPSLEYIKIACPYLSNTDYMAGEVLLVIAEIEEIDEPLLLLTKKIVCPCIDKRNGTRCTETDNTCHYADLNELCKGNIGRPRKNGDQ